jgi:hypothetical protein
MATSPNATKGMQAFVARYNTFTTPHNLGKRRASAQGSKKKAAGAHVVEWPHERPSGDDVSIALSAQLQCDH